MNDCTFCDGKIIKANISDGIKAKRTMMDGILSIERMDNDKKESLSYCGIRLKGGNKMAFDNSSGEFEELQVEIRYCPFCGRELECASD